MLKSSEFLHLRNKFVWNSLLQEAIAKLKEQVPQTRGEVFGFAADLCSKAEVDALVAKVKAIGFLDILVNNAGYYKVCDALKVTDEEWMDIFNANVLSGIRFVLLRTCFLALI